MNILYLLPFWPHLYTPFLFREIAWMKRRGHRVAVVSMRQWPDGQVNVVSFGLTDVPVLQARRRFEGDKQLLGDLVRAAPAFASAGGPAMRERVRASGARQGLQEWATLKRVLKFARDQGSEVIDAHWASEAAEMARQIGQETGLRYSVTMHGGDLHRNPSPALPGIVRDAAAICPVSLFIARLLQGHRPLERLPRVPPVEVDPARLRIRPNGVPEDIFAPEPVTQSDEVQIVGTIGRLDEEKRHRDLVQAVGELAPEFPGLRLRIIGGGQLKDALLRQAEQLGITDRVEITGPKPWPEVIRLVKQMHVYVQASDLEGCSLATLEGACQGMPVIASRVGSHEELIDEGINGHLFDPADVPALREHLRSTLLARAAGRRAMGEAMLRIVRERFFFDNLMPRVESILQAVRDGRPLPT